MQADGYRDTQVPWPQFIIWWWLALSFASLPTGLLHWCWVWTCLPTQLMAPDSLNVMSHPAQAKSLLLEIVFHKTGWLNLGPSLLLLLDQICCLKTPSSTTGTCQTCGDHGVVPPSSVEIIWISKQYQVSGNQAFASQLATGMVNGTGCHQMTPSLWGHSSCSVV